MTIAVVRVQVPPEVLQTPVNQLIFRGFCFLGLQWSNKSDFDFFDLLEVMDLKWYEIIALIAIWVGSMWLYSKYDSHRKNRWRNK